MTNKTPDKSKLRDMADRLWARAVLDDWANQCAVCGTHSDIQAHHLIRRANEATRYDLNNGVALCTEHHLFCPKLSPHKAPVGWLNWLRTHSVRLYEWRIVNKWKTFEGTKNKAYYRVHILRLREYVEPEDFERICGVRLSRLLEEQEAG